MLINEVFYILLSMQAVLVCAMPEALCTLLPCSVPSSDFGVLRHCSS